MTIGVEALPMPSNYAVRKPSGVFESRASLRNLHFTNQPDATNLVRVWLLSWQMVRRESAAAIWQHYEQHALGSFAWTPPAQEIADVGDPVRHFRWLQPPTVQWTSSVSASVTGELEEVLAFIPT